MSDTSKGCRADCRAAIVLRSLADVEDNGGNVSVVAVSSVMESCGSRLSNSSSDHPPSRGPSALAAVAAAVVVVVVAAAGLVHRTRRAIAPIIRTMMSATKRDVSRNAETPSALTTRIPTIASIRGNTQRCGFFGVRSIFFSFIKSQTCNSRTHSHTILHTHIPPALSKTPSS